MKSCSCRSWIFLESQDESNNSAAYNFAYNLDSTYTLASSSYELNKFSKLDNNSSILETSKNSLVASSSHHIKFNNSKIDEMNQIENQLKNLPNYVPKIPILEESKSIFFSHPTSPPLNINIIKRRYIKRSPFIPNVEWIKLDYFSPYNTAKRNYFKQLPPQVRNALWKQYEKYMQHIKMTIPFFHWFFKFRKPLERIATLTSKQAIENSPHNKKILKSMKFKSRRVKWNKI